MRRENGFTLIELLVVVAIISLLVSILQPSLQKAKYLARCAVCLSNIRGQSIAQMTYAADGSAGRFPSRTPLGSTDYVRTPIQPDYPNGDESGPWYTMKKQGDDIDTGLMICPLTVQFADSLWGYFKDTTWHSGMYGSWDTECAYIISVYMWFAGYAPQIDSFADNEPLWPSRLSECTGQTAFITHTICYYNSSDTFDDWSHQGAGRLYSSGGPVWNDLKDLVASPDQAVGYADGHVEVHEIDKVKYRATSKNYWTIDYYY
ncbi:MAG: type II secretion system protein [Planctomycetota bacterium]|nr:type II secretion system protein [Planctomycetota bacterium]